MMIKYFEKNTKGRDFFTTDIHGYFDLLHEQMNLHAFNTSKDRLFVGGDNCDRGPNSDWILDYINESWYHSIRGNHEEMVISFYEQQRRQPFEMLYCNGGEWYFDCTPEKQKAIYESFKALPLAIELQARSGRKIGLVHAECPYNDWDKFKNITKAELEWGGESTAQWARTKYNKKDISAVKGVDVLLVGHSPTTSGEIEELGNVKYCDLGSFFRDKICFMEIE